MRFTRLITALVGAGLLSLPVLALGASPAQAAGTFQTRIAIARSPSHQLFGYNVQVGARLESYDPDTATWGPVGDGETLTLERRRAGSASFAVIDNATADAEGLVVFTTKAVSNASYRVSYAGGDLEADPTTVFLASTSSPVAVKVHRNLGARKNRISGPKFRFYGKVSPKYSRQQVVLQRKLGGGAWKRVAAKKTTKYSRWSFVVFAKRSRGVVQYRTFTPRSPQFTKSYSRVFKITTF